MEKEKSRISDLSKDHGKLIILSFLLLLFLIVCINIYKILQPQKIRVSFLDIGQGDAILITTPSGKQMLIDGGPANNILEELSKEVSYFDRSLDIIVATHPDSDHVTGLIPVLKKYNVLYSL